MNLEHRVESGVDVVKLPERLVMANATEAREAIKGVIERGSGKLILDMSDTTFMDSSGLAVLVSSLRATHSKSGEVILVNVGNTVRALLELTRLHTVFSIFDDEAGALRAMG